MEEIRVLIADDSSLARAMIIDVLSADGDIKIVGEAENGIQAVEMATQLHPHIITMDLHMPRMNGFDAIQIIMNRCPVPILVISSQSDAVEGFQAVSLGALEVLDKAHLADPGCNSLLYKIKFLSQVKVIRHIQDFKTKGIQHVNSVLPGQRWMVGIAASTGGPKAISVLLSSLPPGLQAPVLIAQHIGGEFAQGLVSFLRYSTKLHISLALDKEPVQPSHIYIAPSGMHLTVTKNRTISLIPRQNNDMYVPSCDKLFSSLASCSGEYAVGIVLTGMGRDGSTGAAMISSKGGCIIAQDEATSAVFGMPKVVIESGYAHQVLPLGEISKALVDRMNRRTHHGQ